MPSGVAKRGLCQMARDRLASEVIVWVLDSSLRILMLLSGRTLSPMLTTS